MKKISVSLDSDVLMPEFALPSTEGGRVLGNRDFRQQSNLVILFLATWSCDHCLRLLYSLRDHQDMLMWLDARVLAVTREPLDRLAGAVSEIGPGITFLSDVDGKVTAAFREESAGGAWQPAARKADPGGNEPGAAAAASTPFLVITDRFGAVFLRMEMEDGEEIDFGEVESTLMFIATQCPECGRPGGDTLPYG